ncbi:MAG: acyl-CoA thioesterase [Fastidiosipilaceae bacterium]|jgi:acyl-CoA thioester hydrolase
MTERLYEHYVQYYETDKMGIVHHSNYIRFFEEGRVHFLDRLGISFHMMEEEGVGSPVLDIDCEFKSGAKFADVLIVYCRLTKYNGIRLRFEYEIVNKLNGKLHACGNSGHCFVDLKTHHPIALQKTHPELNEKIVRAIERGNPPSLDSIKQKTEFV